MKVRGFFAIVFTVVFLTGTVSAAGLSLDDLMNGESKNAAISVPQLPPPEGGSVLQRKVLDSQPFVYKTSDRLLYEAEISRDLGNKEYNECMAKVTEDINNLPATKQHGAHYTVDQIKKAYPTFGGNVGYYSATDICVSALQNYEQANKQYNAALKAAGDKDYERIARIFDSSAEMYRTLGATKAQKQVENAAMAARARAAAESLFLPLPEWIALCGIMGGLLLIRLKKE